MKTLLIIEDSVANKISYYHLALFLVFLPFDRFFSELTLISLLVHTLIHFKKVQLRQLNKETFWLSSLFILTAVTTLYSVDKRQGFSDIEKRLAIILFPLILATNPLSLDKYKFNLLKIFSLTCVLTIIYLFIHNLAVIRFNNREFSALFTAEFINHNFSAPIEMHATYLSIYALLSLATCVYFLMKEGRKSRTFYIIQILFLLAGIIQLSSRSAFLAMLLILLIVFPIMLLHKRKHKIMLWVIATGALGIFFLSLTIFTDLKKRNITALKEDLSRTAIQDQLESRVVRWGCAFEVGMSAPIFGYGNGSEIKKLKEKYYEKKYYVSYLNELNAHNQFLGFFVSYGIIGLLLYVYVLFRGFRSAIANKDFIFVSFLVIVSIVSISENIIDVNKGIFFYSFFMTFFLYTNPIRKTDKDKSLINNAINTATA